MILGQAIVDVEAIPEKRRVKPCKKLLVATFHCEFREKRCSPHGRVFDHRAQAGLRRPDRAFLGKRILLQIEGDGRNLAVEFRRRIGAKLFVQHDPDSHIGSRIVFDDCRECRFNVIQPSQALGRVFGQVGIKTNGLNKKRIGGGFLGRRAGRRHPDSHYDNQGVMKNPHACPQNPSPRPHNRFSACSKFSRARTPLVPRPPNPIAGLSGSVRRSSLARTWAHTGYVRNRSTDDEFG